MRKSILTLGIAAVLTGVLATCSMTYAADDELAQIQESGKLKVGVEGCLLYTSPSPRDRQKSRMPSSA